MERDSLKTSTTSQINTPVVLVGMEDRERRGREGVRPIAIPNPIPPATTGVRQLVSSVELLSLGGFLGSLRPTTLTLAWGDFVASKF